jgi:hypothetical protein
MLGTQDNIARLLSQICSAFHYLRYFIGLLERSMLETLVYVLKPIEDPAMKKWHKLSLPTGDGRNILSKRVLCESEEIEDHRKDFADENLREAKDVTVDEE